jgi:hypothetical protein
MPRRKHVAVVRLSTESDGRVETRAGALTIEQTTSVKAYRPLKQVRVFGAGRKLLSYRT